MISNDSVKRNNISVLDLFQNTDLLKVCAPMVRYSKLQFRSLVRKYNCDLCYTPMILADSFCASVKARRNEFTTNANDKPVIVQLAANNTADFVGAAQLVSQFSDGIDLNCGCPQTWAKQKQLGCALLNTPEVIYDIVRQCRNQICKPFTVSVKIRILNNISNTVELCKQLEKAGVSFIAVHARPTTQHLGEVNVEALRLIQENVNIPVIANGGVRTLEDCYTLQEKTKCRGIMVADGLLTNPSLFSGSNATSNKCIQDWLDICYNSTLTEGEYSRLKQQKQIKALISDKPYNLTFQCFHHHLVFMMAKILPRKKRQIFNNLRSFEEVLNFMQTEFGMQPRLYSSQEFSENMLLNVESETRPGVEEWIEYSNVTADVDLKKDYDYSTTNGKYFKTKVSDFVEKQQDYDLSQMFLEDG